MKSLSFVRDVVVACAALQTLVHCVDAAPEVDLPISATTADVDSDNTAVYYSSHPVLLGNDGSAAAGGFHAWSLGSNASKLPEVSAKTGGRSKLVGTVYDVGKKDLIITIAMPDSVLRVFDAEGKGAQVAEKKAIGDWSALCPWKSAESGNQYFYMFGKKQAVQYLIRQKEKRVEVVEVSLSCFRERVLLIGSRFKLLISLWKLRLVRYLRLLDVSISAVMTARMCTHSKLQSRLLLLRSAFLEKLTMMLLVLPSMWANHPITFW